MLNEEERAAFQAIDASLTQEEKDPLSFRVYNCCVAFFCNRAFIALLIMAIILIIGVALFGVTRIDYIKNHKNNSTEDNLRIAGAFLISAGLFGLLGGIANVLALWMLFYEFPLIYGTGYVDLMRSIQHIPYYVTLYVHVTLLCSYHPLCICTCTSNPLCV